MDKLKLSLLKETVAEKLASLTYIVSTSMLVDNDEYMEFLVDYLDGCINGLTEETIEGEI